MRNNGWKTYAITRVRELDDELAMSRPIPADDPKAQLKESAYWAVRGWLGQAYTALRIPLAIADPQEAGSAAPNLRVSGDLAGGSTARSPTTKEVTQQRGAGAPETVWTSIHRGEEDLLLIARQDYVHLTAVRLKSQLSGDPFAGRDPNFDEHRAFLAQYAMPGAEPSPPSSPGQDGKRSHMPGGAPQILGLGRRVLSKVLAKLLTAVCPCWQHRATPPTPPAAPPPNFPTNPTPPDLYSIEYREGLKAILNWFNRASDQAHVDLRAFKEAMVRIFVACVAGTALLVGAGALNPRVLALCGPPAATNANLSPSASPGAGSLAQASPSEDTGAALIPRAVQPSASPRASPKASGASAAEVVCLDGSSAPGQADILFVALLGAIGGLVSALIAFRGMQTFSTPYNLQWWQLLLKIPAGALTAIVGLLALQHNAFGVLSPQTGTSILAYATLFGIGQLAVTSQLDKRASTLLGSAQVASATGNPAAATAKTAPANGP